MSTNAPPGLTLIDALLWSPLVGVRRLHRKDEPGRTFCHRVEVEGLPLKEWGEAKHATAVCGEQVKLIFQEWRELRTRGTPYTRCPACRTWKKAAP